MQGAQVSKLRLAPLHLVPQRKLQAAQGSKRSQRQQLLCLAKATWLRRMANPLPRIQLQRSFG